MQPAAVSYAHPTHKRRPAASKVVDAYTEPKSSNLEGAQPRCESRRANKGNALLLLWSMTKACIGPQKNAESVLQECENSLLWVHGCSKEKLAVDHSGTERQAVITRGEIRLALRPVRRVQWAHGRVTHCGRLG